MRVSPRAAPCRAYYLFLWLCFCVFVVPFFFYRLLPPRRLPCAAWLAGGCARRLEPLHPPCDLFCSQTVPPLSLPRPARCLPLAPCRSKMWLGSPAT